MKLRAFGATDIGKVKENNEDSHFVDAPNGVFIVADGVGGHAAGETASKLAVDTVVERVLPWVDKLRELASTDTPEGRRDVLALLEDAVRLADQRIFDRANEDPHRYRGMATTLDVLLVTPGGAFIAHIGDSRVYLVRGGAVTLLTTDHTIENLFLKEGKLTPDEIARMPRKNALSRALGLGGAQVDVLYLDVLSADRFLLCSDGLSRYLGEGDLTRLVNQGVSMQSAAGFTRFANDRGGKDNVTAVLVLVDEPGALQQRFETTRKIGLLRRTALFANLTDQEMLRVLPVTVEIALPPGKEVVREGEPGDELFVLLEGKVEIESGGVLLTTLGPGAQFGEQALVDSLPRSATVRTTEASRLLRLRRRDFEILTKGELASKLLWNLVHALSQRLRTTSWQLSEQVKLSHRPA